MNTCKECNYWSKARTETWGRCYQIMDEVQSAIVENNKETMLEWITPATYKDFGCIHWEAKDELPVPKGDER